MGKSTKEQLTARAIKADQKLLGSKPSEIITVDIASHCQALVDRAVERAELVVWSMKQEIERTAPNPYPYRKKHMKGNFTISKRKRRYGTDMFGTVGSNMLAGRFIYGVYNRSVPHLVHLINLGHRMVTYSGRWTKHNFLVNETQDTGKFIPGTHFMDDARNKAYEELNKEIQKLVEGFNNGKQ